MNDLHTYDLSESDWRKSSYSNAGQQCVEVANLPGGLALRDSKDVSLAPLRVTTAQWTMFCDGVVSGAL
ncbi:DUF397 domain-containing protein [Streptomyces sp. GZWMJZ-114]|uniref:DUF397 domain-containing protein n=1 Tax=Streptomyces sp. GZWMJZ-114 TaxID=2494734 RepID=UPI0010101373|nr:DUF397 domain-containing protein [Streptomyces sp. GZWMJZ-114]